MTAADARDRYGDRATGWLFLAGLATLFGGALAVAAVAPPAGEAWESATYVGEGVVLLALVVLVAATVRSDRRERRVVSDREGERGE